MKYLLPIYLDQPANGSILPLLDFVSANEVHPLGDAPTASDDVLHTILDGDAIGHVDASLSVGLFGMAGAESKASFETRTYEWSKFGDRPSSGEAGVGYVVQWGFGYRLHLQSERREVASAASLQALGFKSRLKGLQTSFAAESFGVADVSLYGSLPAPDGYDATTLAAFERAVREGLSTAIRKKSAIPVPMGVYFAGDYAKLAVRKAMAVRLAASAMAEGLDRARATERARKAELPEADVTRAYRAWARREEVARAWLSGSARQRTVETALPDSAVPAAPVGGAAAALEAPRIIVRSQLMDIETSSQVGYGGIAEGKASAAARRLVFEVFRRRGLAAVVVESGIARLDADVSGFIRLNCYQADISSQFQGSFSGATAEAALKRKTADISVLGHGYSTEVELLQLGGTADATRAPDKLAVVPAAFKLLAKDENHKLAALPGGVRLQLGPEQDARGFPGARAINAALQKLSRRASLESARDHMRRLGFEAAVADAVYSWRRVEGAKPAREAAKQAQNWLARADLP